MTTTYTNKIPIMRPYVGDEEAEAAAEVVRSGWLTSGPRVKRFEQAVADYVGVPEAVAVSNGTTALHLALLAAGVGPGDEVICPSFTFIATANAIRYTGAMPVFVDIDPRTYNIDPALIEPAITERTKAIMPVAQIGLAADAPAIMDIARRRRLLVVEDAAPSLGAVVDGRRVGNLTGDLTCFSFHPRKSITTGEGGMIVLWDAAVAERLRKLRSHAVSISSLQRFQTATTDFETFEELGYNCRMSDVQAAIGCVQMTKLDFILAERRRLALRYSYILGQDDRLAVPFEPEGYVHTYQSYVVRLVDGADQRPRIMRELAEQGITTRKGVMACHLEPYYVSLFREQGVQYALPVTERADIETLLLPLWVGMTNDEQDTVMSALLAALD